MEILSMAAVLRAGKFSPNHIGNDAAILHAVVGELQRRGFPVTIYTEQEFCDQEITEDAVISMARGEEAVGKMQSLEDSGRLVFNSGYGIENCTRMIMVRVLKDAGINMPTSHVVDTDTDVRRLLKESGGGSWWVKKGDAPVLHLEDMCRCRHEEETQEILHEFFFRKIRKAVVSKDIAGEKIRCYGIASTGWFHCFMPFSGNTKLDEKIRKQAEELSMKAARTLKVDIFGCDLTVTPEGECYLANFDDWPSFAPIRKEAAKEIAKAVTLQARKKTQKKRKTR